ncbi:unnamed protein product [Lactuca saligna]|uniref:Uncharacterized protein n=1 Tax=Lactuca saligna TaxID=75948 RepID=A0AA36A492_LACSI|nr:unnamed protein product [Lactuca saligna]
MAAIRIFHTTNIILTDKSKFTFIGSISESLLRDVPATSEVLRTYHSLPVSGFCPMTDDVRNVLDEADKPKKGGKKRGAKVGPCKTPQALKKKKVKKAAHRPLTPTLSASGFTFGTSTSPLSALRHEDPDTIYGVDEDDFGGFTYSLFNIMTESDDDAPVTLGKLKAINEKLDLLIQFSKTSTNDDYSQAMIKSFLETLTKEHTTNPEKTNQIVDASASICKETTEKVDKLINDARSFMTTF